MNNKKDNSAIAQTNWDRYTRARDRGHSKYVEIAQKCDDFYMGKQWSEEDKQSLEDEGRPALTINNILPTVNTALGEQANRHADIKFKPKRGKATEAVAEVLTKLTDHILDENHFSNHLEPMVYADGLIQDRGYYDVRLSFDEVIEGEVDISVENPIAVIPDPDATSYDPRKWNEVFITRWMSVDQIGEKYGEDKKNELINSVGSETFGKDSVELAKNTFGGEDHQPSDADMLDGSRIKNIRVVERQFYKTKTERHFVDPYTRETRRINPEWQDDHIENVRAQFDLKIIARKKRAVYWVITADKVVLHDDWSPYRSFTIIPYFPIFRRGKPIGMVRNLLSPQEFLNKSRSQELHIVNTTANSGWIIEEGSLANMSTEDLEERGAESGLVMATNPGFKEPSKIKPNPVPTGVDRISTKGAMDIKEISGVNESMLGMEAADVSGIALEQRTARGQVQLQLPFSNLEFSRQLLAEKILELVQDFYTQERIYHITNYSEPEQPREEMIINQEAAGDIVNDLTVGEYDTVVSSTPARDSFNEAQFAEALSLRNAGVMIPDHVVVEHSHLQRKHEVARLLKDMAGLGEVTEEQAQMQQMQQQLAMQREMLELEELSAKIEQLQSNALLNNAKADDLQRGQFIKQLNQMQAEHQRRMKELQARMQMAVMGHTASLKKQEMSGDNRLASDALKVFNTNNNKGNPTHDPRS
jgi:hypothetical protein